MKNNLLLIVSLMAINLCSCGLKIKTSSDNCIRKFEIKNDLKGIQTETITNVEYSPGEPSFELYAPKEVIDNINLYVNKNGILTITQKENRNINGYINSTLKVTYPSINYFGTSGTGDIKIKNLKVSNLKLASYGTGDIDCENSKCENLQAETVGTGDIEINEFSCNSAILNTNGTGDIELKQFKGGSIIAITTGTGDIILKGLCTSLSHEASGTGKVDYKELKIK